MLIVICPTQTATATVTSTQTDGPAPLNKRAAGTIPDWASTACGPDVTARFSSACSCIGITSTVVTVSAPVLTDYVDISTIVTNTVTLETQTSLTTKTGTTTTTSIVFETTAPVCGLTRACNISGPDNYRAACGEQAGCVCNILYGAGLYGSCAGCISDGNFCWNNGPDSNCKCCSTSASLEKGVSSTTADLGKTRLQWILREQLLPGHHSVEWLSR